MKNIFKTLLASLILMTSCTADNDSEVAIAPSVKQFFASIEASSTRTYADEDGNLLWNANDMITAFYGDTYPRKFKFMGTDGKNYGQFDEIDAPTGSYTANSLTANYAIYPYHEATEISNSGVISYVIPATQSYKENSFGLGANVMVAVTKNIDDNFLAFKNLGGYFEFSLYGNTTVKSIEFKGNNDEELAGAVNITASNQSVPTFEFVGETTKTLTLDCGENGVELSKDENNPTKFWFVVPAIEYTKGITITITDVDGGTMEKTTKNSITVNRSSVKPLRAFLVETTSANTPPNNQIWYTSSNSKVVTPDSHGFSGANSSEAEITSNIYDNGKGIITFSQDVYSTAIKTFANCSTLKRVILPESITWISPMTFYKCNELEDIVLPKGLQRITSNTFYGCKKLAKIDVPKTIDWIDEYAFQGCSSLTSIVIPDGVTFIGQGAFYECSSLQDVYCTSLTPPNIYSENFWRCDALQHIYVPESAVDDYKDANGWKDYADKITGYNFAE